MLRPYFMISMRFKFPLKPEEHIGALVLSNEEIVKRTIPPGASPVIGFFTGKSEHIHHKRLRSERYPHPILSPTRQAVQVDFTSRAASMYV